MRIIECEQRSGVWLMARAGRVTSSEVANVMATRRDKNESAKRRNYRVQLAVERLTGHPIDGYVSKFMLNGVENEPVAKAEYELARNVQIQDVGFVLHPTIDMAGASPDGLCCDVGCIEAKCPQMSIHLEYLLAGKVPDEYTYQVQWVLACTERQWCDFVSYCADQNCPDHLRLFIVRCERDDAMIRDMEAAVRSFLREIDELIERLPKPEVAEVRG